MLYQNVVQSFFTGSSNGTSAYFIFPNGMIRAKTADQMFHIRPGKNICFVDEGDSGILLGLEVIQEIMLLNNENLRLVVLDDNGNRNLIEASITFNQGQNFPFDFLQNADGTFGGTHVGHEIVPDFNGGNTGITYQGILSQIPAFLNPSRTEIIAAYGDVQIAI